MKAGLITTQYAVNYGAVLQAFALRKAIENMGQDCEIINFKPDQKVNGRRLNLSINGVKDFANSIYCLCNFIYRKRLTRKISKFDEFLDQYCNLSREVYKSYSDLRERLPKYEFLVCGSDQIWNLNLLNDPAYFLRFEDIYPEISYIAYAPSITEKLTDIQYSKIAENIAHFSAISIREKDGAEVVGKLTRKSVKNVLDPVFLLDRDEWSNIAQPMDIKEPYILLYSLAGGEFCSRVIEKLRKKLGYKIISINTKPYNKFNADECFYDVSPQNFVWLFQNAEFVCANSFHATAFSVLFEKQFFCISTKNRSSREESLLSQLTLGDRVLYDMSLLDKENIQFIDYSLPNQRLEELKKESLVFLRTSFEKVKIGD